MLHLDVMTVTGKTLKDLEELKHNGFYEHCDAILKEKAKLLGCEIKRTEIIHDFDDAKGTDGSIAILKGNLAPEGCVIKHTACPKNMFETTLNAKPFDSEEACIDAVLKGQVQPGDAIFIRYEGPKGSGMPEMFYTGEAICSDPELIQRGTDYGRPFLGRIQRTGYRPCKPGGGNRRTHCACGGLKI